MALTIAGCPLRAEITTRVTEAAVALDGIERADIDFTVMTDEERAALALAECVTRLADRPDAVPDDVWAEAAAQYDEAALASLVVDIAAINAWNRLNAATRQIAGAWAG